MALFELQNREHLPEGVAHELEQFTTTIAATFEAEHDGDTGEHTDLILDSITTRDANLKLPITGNLQILQGRLMFDKYGNGVHKASIRPPQIVANVDDYAPAGGRFAFVIEVSTDADREMSGLECYERFKQLCILGNYGNFNLTLLHNDAGSKNSNRFGLPGGNPYVLGSGEYTWLYYNTATQVWRIVGS